mgnify:CR=1 FL=1
MGPGRRLVVVKDITRQGRTGPVYCKAGRAAVRRAPPPLQEQFSAQFRALSPRRQARIDGALREVVSMMEAESLETAPLLVPTGVSTDRHR